MENLQLFLLILQVVISIILIICILIQRSDGDSLGGIGGGSGGLTSGISSKASANALTKFTIFLVATFMLNSLILARISNSTDSNQLQIDKVLEENQNQKQNNKPVIPPVE